MIKAGRDFPIAPLPVEKAFEKSSQLFPRKAVCHWNRADAPAISPRNWKPSPANPSKRPVRDGLPPDALLAVEDHHFRPKIQHAIRSTQQD
jgi:hypothetical protein